MPNRYSSRGTLKEKDSKLDDGSIFKLLSPAHESMANQDPMMQDKTLGQKALHLPPLRLKTIRSTKTAASLRGITSESLKQILKDSINFSERLCDVQLHSIGGPGDSMREVANSLMHENPQYHHQSLLTPTSQHKMIAPIDVKNFQLSLAPPATVGRVGKPSRLVVSNQASLQNVFQPVAPKPITPSASSPFGAIRASSRGRKVAIKYFGFDKTEQVDSNRDNGKVADSGIDVVRSQMQMTCLEFKPTHYPYAQESETRRKINHNILESPQRQLSTFEHLRPTTSNDHHVIPSQVPDCMLIAHVIFYHFRNIVDVPRFEAFLLEM
jgi:hypothetical protein